MVPPKTRAGQTKSAKLGQPMSRDGSFWAYSTPSKIPSAVKASAHVDLVAPGVGVLTPLIGAALLGSSEYDRSFQVICGTSVSMRGSTSAAANCT